MRNNTKWIIGLVAGTIAITAVTFLVYSEKGAKAREKFRRSGSKLTKKAKELFGDRNGVPGQAEKFNLQEELA